MFSASRPFRRNGLLCLLTLDKCHYARLARRSHNPSLQHFLLRAQGLQLYRNVVRLVRPLDPKTKKEVLEKARHEYNRRKHEKDLEKLRYFLAQGQRDYHQFQTYLALSWGKNP